MRACQRRCKGSPNYTPELCPARYHCESIGRRQGWDLGLMVNCNSAVIFPWVQAAAPRCSFGCKARLLNVCLQTELQAILLRADSGHVDRDKGSDSWSGGKDRVWQPKNCEICKSMGNCTIIRRGRCHSWVQERSGCLNQCLLGYSGPIRHMTGRYSSSLRSQEFCLYLRCDTCQALTSARDGPFIAQMGRRKGL